MNLILLFPEDIDDSGRARLAGRRFKHVLDVHRAGVGDELVAGMVNGQTGTGRITGISSDAVTLELSLVNDPPPPLPATVVLALPRPKVLRRVLFSLTVLGVKRIILINAGRVEKSYWQTPFLRHDEVQRQFVLGLEQARDTVLPELVLARRFKPFVEDELPALIGDAVPLLCHPGEETACPRLPGRQVLVAIGPEGGFVPFEADLFRAAGFRAVSFGPRILNVEAAVPALVAAVCGAGPAGEASY